jgi:hypothetical protein
MLARPACFMSDTDDLLAALAPVAAAFRRLGVDFYIGGSVASTYHGAIRSTMDVDLVCDLRADQVAAFVATFGQDCYISEAAVRDAVERRSCFNVIHLPSAFKVDVFVSRGRPFDVAAMGRAAPQRLGGHDSPTVPIATAEDSIIAKLEWYRLGDESSQRQWDDVTRLVALLGDTLDMEHMQRMAASVGVSDLLERLLGGG